MSFSSDIRQLIRLIGLNILLYISAVKNCVNLIQYFCGRLDFVGTFTFVNYSLFISLSLLKESKDMVSVYAINFMKLSCFDIWEAVFDVFASLCFND